MKERIKYIDLIKGTGIILVVIGHLLPVNTEVRRIIFTFHMPLFFFLAGFFHKPKEIGVFIVDKTKKLLVPYLFFFFAAEGYVWLYDLFTRVSFNITTLGEIFTGCEYFTNNVPLWFLLCLFEVAVLYNVIIRICPGRLFIQSLLVLIMSIGGYVLCWYSCNIPYFVDSALSSLIFYHVGFLFYKNREKFFISDCCLKNRMRQKSVFRIKKNWLAWGRILFLFVLFLFLSGWAGDIDIRSNRINCNYFIFIGTAFAGIFFIVFLCQQVNSIHLINYFGRNSLVIMSVHVPLFLLANYFNNYILRIGESVLYETVRVVVIFTLCSCLAEIMNHYAPKLAGKWK